MGAESWETTSSFVLEYRAIYVCLHLTSVSSFGCSFLELRVGEQERWAAPYSIQASFLRRFGLETSESTGSAGTTQGGWRPEFHRAFDSVWSHRQSSIAWQGFLSIEENKD
ncbi:Hypothetical predicted protein [Olea europaea subsp. europaea]|uniref:Uncharacterized protein n=1 Tax=Olea europaea subsp. europaea TaxID=158383 RepID=A0A8S0PL62_OLEEU|nr:Hypothetical predicted protein [Olea europaea subsp. europaea]